MFLYNNFGYKNKTHFPASMRKLSGQVLPYSAGLAHVEQTEGEWLTTARSVEEDGHD